MDLPTATAGSDREHTEIFGEEIETGSGLATQNPHLTEPRSALNEPGTWGGEYPTRTPDAVCPFPNTGRNLSHGGEPADPGSLSAPAYVLHGVAFYWTHQ